MLRNKPTTAMRKFREYVAHTTDRITLRSSRLHCRTPNQTHALLFYSCL